MNNPERHSKGTQDARLQQQCKQDEEHISRRKVSAISRHYHAKQSYPLVTCNELKFFSRISLRVEFWVAAVSDLTDKTGWESN